MIITVRYVQGIDASSMENENILFLSKAMAKLKYLKMKSEKINCTVLSTIR